MSPKFLCWNPNVRCDGSKRWGLWGVLGHKSKALMNDISVLIKEAERAPAHSITWGYEKSVTWKRALTQPFWHPDLRLPRSRTVRNRFLLFVRHSLWYLVIAAHMGQDIHIMKCDCKSSASLQTVGIKREKQVCYTHTLYSDLSLQPSHSQELSWFNMDAFFQSKLEKIVFFSFNNRVVKVDSMGRVFRDWISSVLCSYDFYLYNNIIFTAIYHLLSALHILSYLIFITTIQSTFISKAKREQMRCKRFKFKTTWPQYFNKSEMPL